MTLKLRPTGLGSGIDKDRPLHRLLRRMGCWSHLRDPRRSRYSALVLVDDGQRPMTRADRVAALEEAKAQFQQRWDAWKTWANLEEMP